MVHVVLVDETHPWSSKEQTKNKQFPQMGNYWSFYVSLQSLYSFFGRVRFFAG